MLELTPKDLHQRRFDSAERRLAIDAGETVQLPLKGSAPGATVSVDDTRVATVDADVRSEPAPVSVLGVTLFTETMLRAKSPGERDVELTIRVAPHARFARSETDDGRIDEINVELHQVVQITLMEGIELAIDPGDNQVIAVHEMSPSASTRVFNVSALGLGGTTIKALSPTGVPLATSSARGALGPTYRCCGPSHDGDYCYVPPGLGDVPPAAVANYGGGYRETYAGQCRISAGFVKSALKGITLSYEAKTWSQRMSLQL